MTLTKKIATQALAAALFISAQPVAFCQQNAAPDDIFKPAANAPTAPAKGNSNHRAQTGVVTIESADGATLTLGPGAKRATSSRYVIGAREDIQPVVVQFSDKNDGFDALQEDLSILTARIRKALETVPDDDAEALTRADASVRRATSGSSVRSMYLEGFGALVFVKTSFPLMDVPTPEPAPADSDADSEWTRAKQELLAEKRKSLALDMVAGQPFDAAQVESLKGQILGALKDAANIHSLKPGDSIAVTVFGPPVAGAGRMPTAEMKGTVLTIRVKKSDIDDFAANKLDATKFKEKATIAAYLGNGYSVTSVNSWAKSGSLQVR